jgi:hypothetical protein
MVLAGTKHFKGNLEQTGNQDSAQSIYQALRLYNSGSMDVNVSVPFSQLSNNYPYFGAESLRWERRHG